MSTLTCPHGCGNLSVFLSKRGRRQRPYLGCRSCGYAEWRGGSPVYDMSCADALDSVDPPVEYDRIDTVVDSDPYS